MIFYVSNVLSDPKYQRTSTRRGKLKPRPPPLPRRSTLLPSVEPLFVSRHSSSTSTCQTGENGAAAAAPCMPSTSCIFLTGSLLLTRKPGCDNPINIGGGGRRASRHLVWLTLPGVCSRFPKVRAKASEEQSWHHGSAQEDPASPPG